MVIYCVFFTVHMTSLTIFIGLCSYVKAMGTDLKIHMDEIAAEVTNHTHTASHQIGHRLMRQIQFHAIVFK